MAIPTGGTVTQGTASISSSGAQMNIAQSSATALINWATFNINPGETVNFNQPSSTSVTWNQINDVNPSQILGNLNANGYVVLQNPNGFYIGGQAVITAHGVILTTATAAPSFASGGPWSFDAPPPTAQIVNYGKINITGGGSAYLIASDIINNGAITAEGGSIGLYDGETVLVSMAPNGEGLSAEVTLPQGSVDNEGKLIADAGNIVAQAQYVNQNGVVQANSVEDVNGTIELLGSSSVTMGANSTITANGDTSDSGASPGGFVILNGGGSYSDNSGSTISVAGNSAGGQDGIVEIFGTGLAASAINSTIDGLSAAAFLAQEPNLFVNPYDVTLSDTGTATSYDADDNLDVNFNLNSLAAYSQIDLQALDDINLVSSWSLASPVAAGILSLTAGNNISLAPGSDISAGQNWTVNLSAGTGFVPTMSQPMPASGSDGIYLNANSLQQSYIQAQNGNINLWAANEVQVGWMDTANTPGDVNLGSGSVTTFGGGNINVTTLYGDVNTGSDANGYDYNPTAPYYTVDAGLGGVSTAAGGNVTIAAGGDVISFMPSLGTSTAGQEAGTGAFGPEPGNVTITAGDNVYGHYVVANGTGTITAGQNVGSGAAATFALSLISGGWNVNAPNGDIYLQEVRNPNGDFNDSVISGGRGGRSSASPGDNLFNYSPQAYVNLTANGIYLTDENVPRTSGPFTTGAVPVLYPPILDITAGSGGVTMEGDVTLYPSPDQNLEITTTDEGPLIAPFEAIPLELLMSDSAQDQWQSSSTFSDTDHGSLADEPGESSPVLINVSGDMENINLITTKVTDITVGEDMIDCGFSGQNLQAGDVTTINVTGAIENGSPYSFAPDPVVIPDIPAGDLPQGVADSWDSIFTLAVDTSKLSASLFADTPVSQLTASVLEYAGLFDVQQQNGQLIGLNPGFVYNTTTERLGFVGPMPSNVASELGQTISILHLVNGLPVVNPLTGEFETDTVSWANVSEVDDISTESTTGNNGNPAPPLSPPQLGYRIGGPGEFDINAGSISLGNSDGIISSGVYDPQGGFDRYANLASITPEGATVNVDISGDLEMLSSTIAALDGGDVNVTSTGGSMDLGSPELLSGTAVSSSSGAQTSVGHLDFGIYTTGGGDVNVTALGDIDIDGSRIATYNGGNIVVESLQGNVNVGSGTADQNTVYVAYVDPLTGLAVPPYQEGAYGSGIIANTLVPPTAGEAFPPDAATAPGDITVLTPEGNIIATTAGILQEALDGSIAPGPTITLTAGTPPSGTPGTPGYSPGYTGNIDLGNSGVIGGTVNLSANGNITGQIVSRQNSNVNAAQSFSGTLLSAGQANVTGGGTISGTIVGVEGATVSGGGGVTAAVLGQNVSLNGGASQSTLGSSATATSSTQSAAQQASSQAQQQVASYSTGGDDENKKKKKPEIRKVGRVTVILSSAVPK
ncbi:MAG TPA: filamentous hemagglutinin N-terminal domain-containing protein [Verrucomicrobiae bacterium]|nr:filamentous hemagglutinin N-terminal domain-containing protein [Verrucomicrobiae bacterium]